MYEKTLEYLALKFSIDLFQSSTFSPRPCYTKMPLQNWRGMLIYFCDIFELCVVYSFPMHSYTVFIDIIKVVM